MRRRIPTWEVTLFLAVSLATATTQAEAPTATSRMRRLENRLDTIGAVVEDAVLPHLEQQAADLETLRQTLIRQGESLSAQERRLADQARRIEAMAGEMAALRQRLAAERKEAETLRAIARTRQDADAEERLLNGLRRINQDIRLRDGIGRSSSGDRTLKTVRLVGPGRPQPGG